MAAAVFHYSDVSRDPTAAARSGVSDRTRADLEALGFTKLGYAAAEHAGGMIISEVWRCETGHVLAGVACSRGQELTEMKTLFDDGRIVSTSQMFPGLFGVLVAHGVATPASAGYHLHQCDKSQLGELFAEHRAHVAEELAGEAAPVPADMQTYFALRLRYREIADASLEIRERVAKRAFRVGVAIAMLCVLASISTHERGLGLVWPVLSGVVAVLILPASHAFGLLVIGPTVARRRKVARVGVEEMLERAKSIGFADLPPQALPVFLPDAPRLDAETERNLEQRDTWVFAANAAAPTFAMAVLGLALGFSGLAVALGLDMASNGFLAMRHRTARLSLLRSWLVPELVASEPVSVGAACVMVSPTVARFQLLLGSGFAMFALYNLAQHKNAPLPALFAPIALGIGVAVGALAMRTARQRHAARREALANAGSAN